MSKTTLRSREMSCPSCIEKIEKALEGVEGVERAEVHFTSGRIDVKHDAERAPAESLVEAVRRSGYESRVSPF